MNILIGTVLLAVVAALLWRRLDVAQLSEAQANTLRTLKVNMPRLAVALIGAGFFATLMPADLVSAYLGAGAGLWAIPTALILGILTPGGAFVSFALAAAALQVGATPPALMTYIAAWALMAFTKVITEELALLGARFILLRVAVSWPLPLVLGFAASALL